MSPLRLLPSLALLAALLPSAAFADSDTSCEHQTPPEAPAVHPSTLPLTLDGWFAIDDWDIDVSGVRLVDADGNQIAVDPVFGDETFRYHQLFEPTELLTPGPHEIRYTFATSCFDPVEVSVPVEVIDELAAPIEEGPAIEQLEVRLFDESSLSIELEVSAAPEGGDPAWVLVDADYSPMEFHFLQHLIAPDASHRRASIDRFVEGEDVQEVCVQATFLDRAGNPSPVTEVCTTEIERIETGGGTPPLGCSVAPRSSSEVMGLAMLLGLLGLRRRRR